MPLHTFNPAEPYYLGVFLTGAYQEILGDLHNLFGDTNAIHVALDEEGGWRFDQVIHGESIAQVLSYVQFEASTLKDRIERQVHAAVTAGQMTAQEGRNFRQLYARGLNQLTYLSGAPKL